jgi:hypothetical protein
MTKRKNTFEKKSLNWVLLGQPGHGSTRFCQVFAYPDLLFYSNQSSHRIDRVSG